MGHVRASLAGAMLAHLRAVKAANLAAEEQLTPGGCAGGGARGGRAASWQRLHAPPVARRSALRPQPLTTHLAPPPPPPPPPAPPLHLAGAKLLPVSSDEAMLPWHTEVVHIPFEKGAPYPGIFIFTQVRGWGMGGLGRWEQLVG